MGSLHIFTAHAKCSAPWKAYNLYHTIWYLVKICCSTRVPGSLGCQQPSSCVPFRATSQCAGYTVGVNWFLWWPDIKKKIGKAVIAAVKSLAPLPLQSRLIAGSSGTARVNSLLKRGQHFWGCQGLRHLKGQLPLKPFLKPPQLHIPLLASPSCKEFGEFCKMRRCTDAHLVHLKL